MQLKPLSNNSITRSRQEAIINFCRKNADTYYSHKQILELVFDDHLESTTVYVLLNELTRMGYLERSKHLEKLKRTLVKVFIFKLSPELNSLLTTS